MGYKYNPFSGQLDLVTSEPVPPDVPREFVTDSGTAIPAANVINFFGDATQGISSSGAGNTVTYTIADATDSQKGVSELATDAEAIAGTDAARTIVPTSLKAKLGVQTAKAVPYGAGDAAAIAWTNALTDGQLVIGSTAGTPAAGAITSTGGTITVSLGSNTINLEVDGSVATSYSTDSGSAVPALGILQVLGGTGVSTSGSGSTITITALNNGDVVGPASSTDNAAVRFNGTTGKLIQNSGVIIDDSDNVTGVTSINVDGASGNTVVVNTDTFVVDATNQRVGIRNTAPITLFHVKNGTSGASAPANSVLVLEDDTNVAFSLITNNTGTGHLYFGDNNDNDVGRLTYNHNGGANSLAFWTFGTQQMILYPGNKLGIGVDPPTAYLHLAAGTATANTGPLKFTSGTNLTAAESGVMEYDGTYYYLTNAIPTRKIVSTYTVTEVTGTSGSMVRNGVYIANNAGLVTLALPTTIAVGDIVQVSGKGAGGWSISQSAGQTIHFLSSDTTTGAGGSLSSTVRYDCVTLRCITANTDFVVEKVVGNLTVV